MFLAHGGVEVNVVAAGSKLKSERPDDFVVVDIVRIAENAPEVSELEAGELAGDEMVGFGVAEEGGRGRVVAEDAIEALEVGGEDVVRLDEDTVFAGADNGVSLCGMLDSGNVTFRVGDEVVFRNGGGEFCESIESLASGFTLLGDIADEVGGLQAIIPFINMSIGEADVEAMLIDSIFKIWFASVFAGVVAPDALIREGKVAVRARDSESITLEKLARGWQPVAVATNEALVVLADGKDGATMLMRIGFATLLVDGAGDFLIKQKVGLDMKSFGSGKDFLDDFWVVLLINLLLDAKSVHVGSGKEIVTVRTKSLGEKTAVIGVRATKLKHKFIIAQKYGFG